MGQKKKTSSTCEETPGDPILSRQVLVPQQKFLVHRATDVSEESQPPTVPHADRLSYSAADSLSFWPYAAISLIGRHRQREKEF
jgi:hypothetical protein